MNYTTKCPYCDKPLSDDFIQKQGGRILGSKSTLTSEEARELAKKRWDKAREKNKDKDKEST
ncbi:MAG: hypothetical protein ACTSP4_00585 [Candidatus Hodarchaeales archaeon]